MEESENRLNKILATPGGELKVAASVEQVLYSKIPSFIMNIKGKQSLYREVLAASQTILYEELEKGKENLYSRIRNRIDTYWEDSMS